MKDITQESNPGYTKILAPARSILNLVEVSRAGWYLREEDQAELVASDPDQWYRVDLFIDRSKRG